ncbi:hypothetical protein [Saliphagus sp. LR7]|uniref:hypothetical protein n=1 Tax=Saliphagus sp. LR7 TaxID=2282654 RepID=UPI000DF8151A|nr:hypothetical protein [Saliphagus sp. LR7]
MTILERATLDEQFPRYKRFDPAVPTWCVTPEDTGYIHRFFNSSPVSPSGRYLALTRFPFEDRLPEPGDRAKVTRIDLTTGETETIAETAGWDTQMGAHVQWGGDDAHLFFNDLDTTTWEPHGVMVNLRTNERTVLDGTVYHVSPDGSQVASPDLLGTRVTQDGYGAIVPDRTLPDHDGAPDDDGVYVTDANTGETECIMSLGEIVDKLGIDCAGRYGPGDYYGFHVAWSPNGERLLFAMRYWPENPENYWDWNPQLITLRADGSNLALALPAEAWSAGGHHVRWTPDGTRVTMNLKHAEEDVLRFTSVRPDGSGWHAISETLEGSGHPSLHPDGRTMVTDSYLHENVAFDDGTVPIRLVDLETETERTILRVPSKPIYSGLDNRLRVDPHPAWGPSHRYVVYNACPAGRRRVFIADLGSVVGDGGY